MGEILHQLICSLSHYLQGFIHPRWCRISSINSIWNHHHPENPKCSPPPKLTQLPTPKLGCQRHSPSWASKFLRPLRWSKGITWEVGCPGGKVSTTDSPDHPSNFILGSATFCWEKWYPSCLVGKLWNFEFLFECNNPKEWSWKFYLPGGRHLDMWGLVLARWLGNPQVPHLLGMCPVLCIRESVTQTRGVTQHGGFLFHHFVWQKNNQGIGLSWRLSGSLGCA